MLQIFMIKLGDMLIVDLWWRCSLYESIVSTIEVLLSIVDTMVCDG